MQNRKTEAQNQRTKKRKPREDLRQERSQFIV